MKLVTKRLQRKLHANATRATRARVPGDRATSTVGELLKRVARAGPCCARVDEIGGSGRAEERSARGDARARGATGSVTGAGRWLS